ncbi:MAG: aminoglycoside phosphotransferase family protein [Legionellales bacterium]|nr:aminoglycoside phosphotransferase family protein [Legionellales bacterium]
MPSSASLTQPPDKLDIPVSLVIELIEEQFPQWAHLPIKTIEPGGWDNKTFRLGEEMSIRLPSAAEYALQVQKEHKWLPLLAPHVSFPIPKPLALGQPSKNYPLNWSIYQWIEGKSANAIPIDGLDLPRIALQLAQFLNELHKLNVTDAPLPGLHNYYRGAHPLVYDDGTRTAIAQLQGVIDVNVATAVWEKAINSTWSKNPLWVHGDFSSGNILVNKNRLTAVIDFGCMGIGDPACDLVIAWTFLTGESRKIFKLHVALDEDTWARARGWALWKAMITLAALDDKMCTEALKQKQLIDEIINE